MPTKLLTKKLQVVSRSVDRGDAVSQKKGLHSAREHQIIEIDQEWNKSQALSQSLRNSSLFSAPLIFCLQSSSRLPLPPSSPRTAKAARLGSGRLNAEGGLPLSRSYSSRPRRRPDVDVVRPRSGRAVAGGGWKSRCAPGAAYVWRIAPLPP